MIKKKIYYFASVFLLLLFAVLMIAQTEKKSKNNISLNSELSGEQLWFKEGLLISPNLKNPPTDTYDALSDPFVFKDRDTWRAYFSRNDGKHSRSWTATSLDGLNWNINPEPVIILGKEGKWDEFGTEVPTVIKNSESYKLWYGGASNQELGWSIGLAESKDGIRFEKISESRSPYKQEGLVLTPDPNAPGQREAIADPSVIFYNGKYLMWFTGNEGDDFVISMATSDDGIHWKRANNYVLKGTKEWELMKIPKGLSSGTVQPSVLFDNGIFRMVYAVFEEFGTGSVKAIGYAESADGFNWIKAEKPILLPGPEKLFTGPALVREKDMFYLYYAGWLKDEKVKTTGIFRAKKEVEKVEKLKKE